MSSHHQHDATELVRTLHRAFNDRDREALLGCLAADVRWQVRGDHPMAGTYDGREEVWQRLFEPLWPSPARVEDGDVLVHGDHVVSLGAEVHNFGEGERAWPTVEILEVRDGQVAARWAFHSDQAELDAFLTRGCAAAGEPSLNPS